MDLFTGLFRTPANPDIGMNGEIRLFIHDHLHIVKAAEFTPQTTLNDYLRKTTFLTGTKVMCREGGCGCCVVTATTKHPITKQEITFAVNSCLVSIFSCEGWKISTVEGIGNKNSNYHKIQKTLVQFNGTQCGFCTSGMVMTMYQLSKQPTLKMEDVENSFGGNICRCTGYRPILAAFKSLCSDADANLIGTVPDIEDFPQCPLKESCENFEHLCLEDKKPFGLDLGGSKWYKVFLMSEIFQLFKKFPKASYRFVAGNTARGVYRDTIDFQLYIDISVVPEFISHKIDGDKLIMGANISLTDTMVIFKKLSKENAMFAYLGKLADHIDLVASVPVRNIGTLAGNLAIKHEHHEFPSDIFLILETVGATMTIVDSNEKESVVSVVDYIYNTKMEEKVVKNIILPALDESYSYTSYKIMPRAQNAHALVNAGFLLKLNKDHTVESARIVFGCINPTFSHAHNLEKYLKGKNLFDNSTLQECFKTLDQELVPDYILPDPKPAFRKALAISLFYKFVLSIAPEDNVSPRNKSGGKLLTRPISKGTQDFSTNESMYPVSKAISKLEAVAQVSGEAEYIMDQPDRPGQLYGALVLANAAPHSVITKIDASKALALKGVVAYFDKNDVKGKNNFLPLPSFVPSPVEEEIFCGGTVKYHSQPIGIVVANTQMLAEKAANLVEVTYIPGQMKPVFTIQDILERKISNKIVEEARIEPKSKGNDIAHEIKGTYRNGLQYHYHMETQCCSVVPSEDGMDVYPSTQAMDQVQNAISESLQIPANKINVTVRRLGGGYGGKITRNSMISCQAALASHKLNKPVKLWLPFETNMLVVGKRCPIYADYKVGVNANGVIQYLDIKVYSDYGNGGNEPMVHEIFKLLVNCYNSKPFDVTGYSTRTDTHANTWCRAPGTTEGMGVIESIMDHIAYVTNKDPIEVRLNNFDKDTHPKLEGFLNSLIQTADIKKRKEDISEFNKNNRWRKKGISVVPMAYPFTLFGNWNVLISVYQSDGTVAISHGGIEMGQGINTKAAQVCAYSLGIPLESVTVKPTNNLVSPNVISTGGSLTSEAVCYAIIKAAEILTKRMEAVKNKMTNPTWLEVVRECNNQNIPLSAMYSFNPNEAHPYTIYGVCATEVEVDILTGNYQISRVDLLEDTGDSMSPEIDIGQVEGAFIMGQGYYTTEEIILSPKGEVLTNRTWNYKPPGAKDIPIDFRVNFPKNNPNPLGILKSKATAEPPFCLTCAVPLAIRKAVASARIDADTKADPWYEFDGPSTVESTFVNSLHDFKQYVI